MSYTGKLLRVNLTTGRSQVEELNKQWAEDYIGGKGLGIKYLYEELAPGINPLSPENKLILMTGIFTGTIIPLSGKLAIITKSPATGTILDCSIGGHFAAELKYAGYDAVILEGKAVKPSYLYIKNDKVEIRDASELWGMGTQDTELMLRDKIDEEVKALVIGPAAENLLTMSCICSEFYRQAGRGGVGAVMGSKNLKAIAVRGSGSISVPNIKQFVDTLKDVMRTDTLTDTNLWANTDGTALLVDFNQESGILPTRNFQDGTFDDYQKINSDAMKTVRSGKKGCFSCALGCGNYSRSGRSTVEGPEYETLAIGGSNCGISDLEAIIEFNDLCDNLGMDTISVGSSIAFAMESTEKGLKDFGLKFGDVGAYLKVPGLIAAQEGIGIELGLGVKKLSEKYGGSDFAMHVKGLEFPGYEPRGSWGMGLAYATSDRGACHMRAWPVAQEVYGDVDAFTIEGKAELVIELQDYNAVKFSLILCDFWALSLETMGIIASNLIDRTVSEQDLVLIGKRVVSLARQFNVREGFTKDNDTLPGRIFKETLKTGATKGQLLPLDEFEKMLLEYYGLRGWDRDGRPSDAKLQELGII